MKGKVSNHFPGHCKDSKDQVLRKPRLLCFGPNDTLPLFWLASSYQLQDSPAGLSRRDHLLPGLPRQHLCFGDPPPAGAGSQLPGLSLSVSSGCGLRAHWHCTLHVLTPSPVCTQHLTWCSCVWISTGVPTRKGAGTTSNHTWMYSCSTTRILWARRNLRTRPTPQSNPKDVFLRLEDNKETGPWFILEICQEVGLSQWQWIIPLDVWFKKKKVF